jgi:hypothetical protein
VQNIWWTTCATFVTSQLHTSYTTILRWSPRILNIVKKSLVEPRLVIYVKYNGSIMVFSKRKFAIFPAEIESLRTMDYFDIKLEQIVSCRSF